METKKNRLRVIRGGKILTNNLYSFVSAISTRTRLMGVIALKVHWLKTNKENFIQWFLLDTEDHGIYDYISIVTTNENEFDLHTDRFMGSLGGIKVNLTEREAIHLIKTYSNMNIKYGQPLPPPSFEYRSIIRTKLIMNKKEQNILSDKIYEKIESPIQLINFFIMRTVGNDEVAKNYLFSEDKCNSCKKFKVVHRSSILLKNNVYLVKTFIDSWIYTVKSVVDTNEGYLKVISTIEVKKLRDEFRVTRAKVIDMSEISHDLIVNEIRNIEHLILFKIKFNCHIESELLKIKPKILKYDFSNGVMLVEYRDNNDHVKEEEYRLSGDLYAIYYITDFDELIICYYKEHDIDGIRNVCDRLSEGLKFIRNVTTKNSVIYEYARSSNESFSSYLKIITTSKNGQI